MAPSARGKFVLVACHCLPPRPRRPRWGPASTAIASAAPSAGAAHALRLGRVGAPRLTPRPPRPWLVRPATPHVAIESPPPNVSPALGPRGCRRAPRGRPKGRRAAEPSRPFYSVCPPSGTRRPRGRRKNLEGVCRCADAHTTAAGYPCPAVIMAASGQHLGGGAQNCIQRAFNVPQTSIQRAATCTRVSIINSTL